MPEAHNLRCLLVEDTEAMRALLSVLLESTGCEIVEVENLRDAKRIVRSRAGATFDFVVLDLELPDGSGLELLPEIDEEVSVIVLTADDSRETYLQCRHAGCEVVLNKSGDLSKLNEIFTGTAVSAASRSIPDFSYPYLRYLAEVRLELEDARQTTDLLGLRRIAHRLRGTAIHFGHPGIGRAAKSISVALASGLLDQVDAEADVLSARIAEALEAYYLQKSPVAGMRPSPGRP
jgi:CheY-like chemotaxis protein